MAHVVGNEPTRPENLAGPRHGRFTVPGDPVAGRAGLQHRARAVGDRSIRGEPLWWKKFLGHHVGGDAPPLGTDCARTVSPGAAPAVVDPAQPQPDGDAVGTESGDRRDYLAAPR